MSRRIPTDPPTTIEHLFLGDRENRSSAGEATTRPDATLEANMPSNPNPSPVTIDAGSARTAARVLADTARSRPADPRVGEWLDAAERITLALREQRTPLH